MRETDPLLLLSPSASDEDHPKAQDAHDALPATTASSSNEQSWTQRVRAFFVEYGAVGLAVHTVLSLAILALVFACVSNGADVSGILAAIGIADSAKGSTAHSAGSFVIAFAIFKLLAPVRVPLTLAITPLLMRALRRRGFMRPPDASSLEAQQQPSPTSHSTSRSDAATFASPAIV